MHNTTKDNSYFIHLIILSSVITSSENITYLLKQTMSCFYSYKIALEHMLLEPKRP